MQNKPKQAEAYFKLSPRILDHLGLSAYNSVQKCLTELVANAYDADAKEVRITLPTTINRNAVIEIVDNGVGMSEKEIREKFLYLGRNKRLDGEKTESGRLVIGSKGIGKLAGFGIASKSQITSWKNKIQSALTLDRATLERLDSLADHPMLITTIRTTHSTGTQIKLLGLHKDLRLPTAETLRRHLFKSLPNRPDFRVFVDGVECSAEDVPGLKTHFSFRIRGVGEVSGFYILATARQPKPGLVIRVRGRVVTEPSLFGLDTHAHGFFTAEKIVGEINADFLDPLTKGKGLDLINTSRDGFLEDAPVVMKLKDWAHKFIQDLIKGVDAKENAKRTNAILSRPAIKDRLDKLPAHIRGTVTNVVKSILSKLRNVETEEAEELIEWVLKYYESSVLRELMRAITTADIIDVEKLSSLIQEWGLKQVNSVVDIIQNQIQIITKLQELITSKKAKEIELHKLVESNLWLVREGLEVWSSDQPLQIVLDGIVNKLYKGRMNIRPDLICRSRNRGNEAVILEFKRPTETIVMKHVTQALEYDGIIKEHRPNIQFTTYVVGYQYDPSVLAVREKQEKAGLYLMSFVSLRRAGLTIL